MNINNVKFIKLLQKFSYPKHKMLIGSSGVLALLELRDNKDLDIFVTKDIYKKLNQNKNLISFKSKLSGDIIYTTKNEEIEFLPNMYPLNQSVEYYLKKALVVQEFYFQSPIDVLQWKKRMNRPKDQQDIKLLEQYLKKEVIENYLMNLK